MNNENIAVALGVLVAVAGISIVAWMMYATMPGPRPEPVYQSGQFVKSVLSGQRGQVVRPRCYSGSESCSYIVRFVGLSMTTQTSLLGPDGPISTEPLNTVELREFEITAD